MQTTLKINGLEVYAYHGWHEQERKIGGRYRINLSVQLLDGAFDTDELSATVDYVQLIVLIKTEMAKSCKTIEKAGRNIVTKIMDMTRQIHSVTLEIQKLNPPVGEPIYSFSVVFNEER